MPRHCALAVVLALSASSASASWRTAETRGLRPLQLEARQIHHYRATPEGEGPWPGVVLAHDSMGLDANTKNLADRLAAEGFLVIAPDLYDGKVALDADKGREMSVIMDEKESVAILEAVAGHLKQLPEVGDHRVAFVGFDMGGRLALLGGMASQDVSAVVAAYGRPVMEVDELRRIGCPILALYGDRDATIRKEDVEAFRQALEAAGRSADVRVYEGAGHNFAKAEDPNHDPTAAKDAWSLIVAFLRDHL